MDELPDEEIAAAEVAPAGHDHDGVTTADDSLRDHLQTAHGLVVPAELSGSTLQGLHDRVHGESHAADE